MVEAIAAREGDADAGRLTGFHPIEQGLFEAQSAENREDRAAGLRKNLASLADPVAGEEYDSDDVAIGAGALLNEVSQTKVQGEKERYSRIDLLDVHANVEGSETGRERTLTL